MANPRFLCWFTLRQPVYYVDCVRCAAFVACGGLRSLRRFDLLGLWDQEKSFYSGNNGVNFTLDIALHRRRLEYPASIFRPFLEVMGVALKVLDFEYARVRIIIPAKYSLIARVGEPKINQCI